MAKILETQIVITGNESFLAGLQKARKLLLWTGIVLTAAGIAAVLFPVFSTLIIELMIGGLFFFTGMVMFFGSLPYLSMRPFFGALVLGLLMIAAGAFLLFNPQAGILALTALIAILFMVEGAFHFALAFKLRPLAGWGWILVSAIASAGIGVMVAAGFPQVSLIVLGILVGINFLSSGIAFISLARAIKDNPIIP